MIDVLFLMFILIFLILFVANLAVNNPVFGAIAGAWLLIIGLILLISGLQAQTGYTMEVVGGTTTITAQYTNYTLPFNISNYQLTLANILGVFFIATSIYIIYRNAEDMYNG